MRVTFLTPRPQARCIENQNRAGQIEEEMRKSFEKNMARLEAGLKETMPGSNANTKIIEAMAKPWRGWQDHLPFCRSRRVGRINEHR